MFEKKKACVFSICVTVARRVFFFFPLSRFSTKCINAHPRALGDHAARSQSPQHRSKQPHTRCGGGKRAGWTTDLGNASQPRIHRTQVRRVREGCRPHSPAQPEGAPRWAQSVSIKKKLAAVWIGRLKIALVLMDDCACCVAWLGSVACVGRSCGPENAASTGRDVVSPSSSFSL